MSFSLDSIRTLADNANPSSLSNRMRARRFENFEALAAKIPRPLRIIDVGGTNEFWQMRGWAGRDDVKIVLINLIKQDRKYANIEPLAGDATNLGEFADKSFDIAFSNSVIEHLFTFENQQKMARELTRVAKATWIQTPNYWFPVEPHFHVPGWQWMPTSIRVAIIQRWRCGWRGPCEDPDKALAVVNEVRLMKRHELEAVFPGARIIPERFGGFVKSWIAVNGF